MPCLNDCSQVGICSFNDTCICSPCYTGNSCEINTNVIQFSLTFTMQWDIRQASLHSNFNTPGIIYTTIIALMLFMAVINNIVCLQTFLLQDIRLTNCGMLQIFYCISGLIAIVGMQLRMLTMLIFDELIQAYPYRYAACNIIPVIVILMGTVCMWLSSILIIEFVLLECFNLSLYRSRRFSVISSIICLLLTIGTHMHEIIARHPLPDPMHPDSYSCTFAYPLPLDIIDKILRVCHIIIPLGIQFIGSICILISITRRTLLVRDRYDYCQVFISEFIKRKHFFVPQLFIILSNLPHVILHLKDQCEDAPNISLLRIHVAFNILVYLPPSMTFFIYIFPSKSYMHKFEKTFMGRLFKRIFQRNKEKKPYESNQLIMKYRTKFITLVSHTKQTIKTNILC
ncbi:unnamed protein product [Rotaria sordida]|uniref:G-protein coupled receptors family 1 profile domain-containing protein n=1 Tax=Rotaria sordida TaxID=392033 RepID=A0A818JXN5_9BILA|nr:unnamed protein product [Rotaria sordida]CAF1020561.1 unnamed protein product [Rotaria sordida]CAF3488030.1 unnamed protein product [Rotaria sordida]CAF3548068.1 unnamed protein product [Rotaria sordida]